MNSTSSTKSGDGYDGSCTQSGSDFIVVAKYLSTTTEHITGGYELVKTCGGSPAYFDQITIPRDTTSCSRSWVCGPTDYDYESSTVIGTHGSAYAKYYQ